MSTDGGAGDSGQGKQNQRPDPNNPDLYQWSGRDRQGRRGPGGQQGQAGSDSVSSQNLPDDVVNNWHPDLSLSSDSAKQWYAASQQQRNKPLPLDQNGDYVVQFGDDLSTIAARELQNQGKAVNKQSIKDETATIISQNDQAFPSLDKNPDLIIAADPAHHQKGWKLHIEDGARATGYNPDGDDQIPRGNDQQRGDDQHRCVAKRPGTGDFTPHGYQNKPSVYVNNFYGNNNTVYEGTNGGNGDQQAIPRDHQCYGRGRQGGRGGQGGQGGQGGDLYSYDGSGGRQNQGGRGQYQGDGSYNPDNNPNARRYQNQNQGGGDLYSYDGSGGNGGRRQPINPNASDDLYSYDGGGANNGGYNPQNNPGRSNDGRGRQQQQPLRPFSNGWGNDGTTYYPAGGDGSQQRQPSTIIINNFYGNNNTVYEGSPQNRIQRHSNCAQDGSDNYYNNGGGQQRYRIQQIPNAVPGDYQAQPIPNARPGDAQYQLINQQNQPRRIAQQNNNPDVPQYNNQKSQLDDSATDV